MEFRFIFLDIFSCYIKDVLHKNNLAVHVFGRRTLRFSVYLLLDVFGSTKPNYLKAK